MSSAESALGAPRRSWATSLSTPTLASHVMNRFKSSLCNQIFFALISLYDAETIDFVKERCHSTALRGGELPDVLVVSWL
jgi:hypothetical protein